MAWSRLAILTGVRWEKETKRPAVNGRETYSTSSYARTPLSNSSRLNNEVCFVSCIVPSDDSTRQMGANGRAFAGVFYPSMQEIWPELYSTSNIRVVEVRVSSSSRGLVDRSQGSHKTPNKK